MKKDNSENNIRLRMPQQEQPTNAKPEKGRKLPLVAKLSATLVVLFFVSLLFVMPYSAWSFSPAYIFESVRGRFGQLFALITGQSDNFGITVCQYLAVVLVGSALAACGMVFQSGFKNMLAGPSTMGVMSGGTLGLMVYLLLFVKNDAMGSFAQPDLATYYGRDFFAIYGRQLFTLAGCFGGVGLVLAVSSAAGRGKLSATAMILSGTVFSSICASAAQVLQYYIILSDPNDSRIEALRELNMGSFNGVTDLKTLLLLGVPIVICLAALLLLRHRLNLLSVSEDEAMTMGVNIRRLRYGVVAIGTVLTAVVVSFCGHIGFLGFMVPLAARRLTGPHASRLLPVSMLLGAILLLLVFDTAYIAGLSDSINLFTSALGAVVLLFALLKRTGGKSDAA